MLDNKEIAIKQKSYLDHFNGSTKRKTVTIDHVKGMCNEVLENKKVSQEEKRGIAIVLEALLFGTKNYKGFQELDQRDDRSTQYTRYYV